MRRWVGLQVTLIVGLLALGLAGCGAGTQGSTGSGGGTGAKSGIFGVTVIDAGCAVVPAGKKCPTHPITAWVVVHRANPAGVSTGPVVAKSTSDKQGRFRFELKPGTYLVNAVMTGPGLPTLSPHATVQVRSGGFARVVLHFDSGIR